ncbi:MAG: hypothetical protein OXC19_11985 [Bryobacterales bacterium]|nr:hypothetical protein [Bryobacterales bacterium]
MLRALQDAGVEHTMIGAMAMGIHGLVRATEDVAMLVRAEKGNIERIRRELRTTYPEDESVEEIRHDDLVGDYDVVRYCCARRSGEYYFDFISRLREVVTFESVESEVKDVEGVRVRVATPLALYHFKKDTVRPIDWQDATAPPNQFQLKDDNWMAVQRFRSMSEWNDAADPLPKSDGFERFNRHNAFLRQLSKFSYPRGVNRYRNLEEAQ